MCRLRHVALLWVMFITPPLAVAEEPPPRVLILGDSVYHQPASTLAKEWKGKAQVTHANLPTGVVFNTTMALDHLDSLLGDGDGDWDVIHFNCGLGDLIHRAPRMKAFRVLPIQAGGVRTTPPDQYEKNLHALVKRLKATGAKLVWASTTPIRHSATNVFEMGSELRYNAIAAKVMKQHQVVINDMYSHVKSLIDMDKPASHGADPFYFDRKPIHLPIMQVLAEQLKMPSLAASEKE